MGKIYAPSLFHCEDSEILEELQYENENILEIKRISKGEEKIKTSLLKIKFDGSDLPQKVFCLGLSYNVERFNPPVKKCYKCNTYNNHWSSECRNLWVCSHCNLNNCPSHDQITLCLNPPSCKYCRPGHPTSDPLCPRYQKEREVVTISYEKTFRLAMPEVR